MISFEIISPAELHHVELEVVVGRLPGRIEHEGRRSNAALERAYSLLDENLAARQRGREFVEKLGKRTRACPKCGSALEWLERGTISGVEYDYYRWCLKGCGLYCYDRRAGDWIKLAG